MALLAVAFFSPIWWVSLRRRLSAADFSRWHADPIPVQWRAKRLPIARGKAEIDGGTEALDCVDEMNTINHYIGMKPIATAPI